MNRGVNLGLWTEAGSKKNNFFSFFFFLFAKITPVQVDEPLHCIWDSGPKPGQGSRTHTLVCGG